jgi:hypothetical protein
MMLTEAPIRENDLIDNEDPRVAKPMTESDFPSRAKALRETAAPTCM